MDRDMRGFEIKKKLAQAFPDKRFKVRIEKYSGGESINIWTDMLKRAWHSDAVWRAEVNTETCTDEDRKALQDYKQAMQENNANEERIQRLVGDYEDVDIDPSSGEVLLGANTFLFVHNFE